MIEIITTMVGMIASMILVAGLYSGISVSSAAGTRSDATSGFKHACEDRGYTIREAEDTLGVRLSDLHGSKLHDITRRVHELPSRLEKEMVSPRPLEALPAAPPLIRFSMLEIDE